MTDDPTKYLEGKRFGEPGGADPNEARKAGNKPWAVRKALARIAAHQFQADLGDAKGIVEEIKKSVFNTNGQGLRGAEMLAAANFAQAMRNYKAMENVINSIDGKLVEKKVEAKVDYAALVAGSIERELQEGAFVDGGEEE